VDVRACTDEIGELLHHLRLNDLQLPATWRRPARAGEGQATRRYPPGALHLRR
jgi:hypothetical protein